jgi:hypothetical protein
MHPKINPFHPCANPKAIAIGGLLTSFESLHNSGKIPPAVYNNVLADELRYNFFPGSADSCHPKQQPVLKAKLVVVIRVWSVDKWIHVVDG